MWQYKRSITVDKDLCGVADSLNFPVPFIGTYDYLAHTDHSGKVTNANGYDIAFFSDAALTSMLDFERHVYNHETGVCEFYVEVPTLDVSDDTVIYLAYGNTAITTDQQNKAGTWSGCVGVYHFGDGTTLDVNDSTGANNGSNNGATATTGKNTGGANFNGSSSIDLGTSMFGSAFQELSVSYWLKTNTSQTSDVVAKWSGDAGSQTFTNILIPGDTYLAAVDDGNGSDLYLFGDIDVIDNTFHYAAITAKKGTGTYILYNNATPNKTGDVGTDNLHSNACPVYIGTSAVGRPLTGVVDEVRISDTARSASWITAEYNSMNDPSTFYGVGDEVPLTGKVGPFPTFIP